MQPGNFNCRIIIQKRGIIENEVGEQVKDWVQYKKIWAKKQRLKAQTSTVNGKETITYAYRFIVRYRTDIEEDMMLIYKGIAYDIKHVNPINDIDLYETHIDCEFYKEGVYNE